jgi:SAM-dependent methyltransferase
MIHSRIGRLREPELNYTGLDILRALEGATNYNALLTDLILRSADDRQPMVDFGAGIGTSAKLLRKQGVKVICVEPDPYLAEGLIQDGFHTLRELEEVNDNSVDFLFSLNVLEHIEDDDAVFKALSRKLKAGGRMFIYVPAFDCLWTGLDDKLKHFRRYTRDGLERLVGSAGLCVRESGYVDTLGFLAALVFKVIGNKSGDLTPESIHFYDRHIIPPSKLLDHLFHSLFGKNVYVLCEKNRPQSL